MVPEAIGCEMSRRWRWSRSRRLWSLMSERPARPVRDLPPRRTPEDLQTEGPPYNASTVVAPSLETHTSRQSFYFYCNRIGWNCPKVLTVDGTDVIGTVPRK